MKTIMIDMDDVLVKYNFEKYIQEFVGKKIDFEHECKEYRDEFIKDRYAEFREKYGMKSLYAGVPLFDDCYDVIRKLNDMYDVYICTDFVWNYEIFDTKNVLMEKYDYLRKKLPFISPDKYIFGKCKKIMNFDIKIDDRIEHLKNCNCKLLYTTWQNKKYSQEELNKEGIVRVDNWKDIENILINKK